MRRIGLRQDADPTGVGYSKLKDRPLKIRDAASLNTEGKQTLTEQWKQLLWPDKPKMGQTIPAIFDFV